MKLKDNLQLCPFSGLKTHRREGKLHNIAIECRRGKKVLPCNPFSKYCRLFELLTDMKEIFDINEGCNQFLQDRKELEDIEEGQTSLFLLVADSFADFLTDRFERRKKHHPGGPS